MLSIRHLEHGKDLSDLTGIFNLNADILHELNRYAEKDYRAFSALIAITDFTFPI